VFTQADLSAGLLDWVLGLLWAVGLVWAAWRARRRWSVPGLEHWLVPVLVLHLAAGVFLGKPMQRLAANHNDSALTYENARMLWEVAAKEPQELPTLIFRQWGTAADEALITRHQFVSGERYVGPQKLSLVDNRYAWGLVLLVWALLPLGVGCYYPVALLLSAVGAAALWAVAQVMVRRLPEGVSPRVVAAAVLLSPTALLWGSGLLKEPIVLAAMAAALVVADCVERGGRWRWWQAVLLPFAVGLGFLIKPYPVVLWVAALLLWVLVVRTYRAIRGRNRWAWGWGIALALTLMVGTVVGVRMFPLAVYEAASSRVRMLTLERVGSEGGLWVDIGMYPLTPLGVLGAAPSAVAAVLVRPWPWEVSKLSHAALAAENMLLLSLLAVGLVTMRWRRALGALRRELLVVVLVAFGLGYAAVLGLSVANLGSIARYRVVVMPMLLGGLALWWQLSRVREQSPSVDGNEDYAPNSELT
jgi:hypothetical protein